MAPEGSRPRHSPCRKLPSSNISPSPRPTSSYNPTPGPVPVSTPAITYKAEEIYLLIYGSS